ncbi:MAG TPA: fused MFS/spermidine synthase [Methylomirabilota bacterium]|nr:fused MFS/spermidine synthase [Methylomirabilota bacterium]
MNASDRQRGRVLTGVLVCFFFSGFTGLVYEVLWIRMLGLVFGQTVFAITTVLAAFMGGLGLGSFLFGRVVDRDQRPLRTYGLIEIGIGVSCLLVPVVLPWVSTLYLGLHRALGLSYFGFSLTQFVLVLAVLLVPTTLMGGTLPVLSRFFARDAVTLSRRVGLLYALNTFGAVAGTAAAGYGLLPLFGVRGTLLLAATLTIGVGALAIVFSAHMDRLASDAPARETEPAPDPQGQPAGVGRLAGVVTLGLGVSGASSMIYEIGWSRALALVLGSSTYAFTAMLVAFLVGIAGGSALFSRLRASRAATAGTFALIQLGIATSALLILPAFEWMPRALLRALTLSLDPGFVMAAQIVMSIAAMIVPTLLIGASFPCAIDLVARRVERAGFDVGRLYSVNTLGAIVGTVLAGFLLIPALGAQTTVKVAVALNALTGLAIAVTGGQAVRRPQWAGIGALAAVTAAAIGWIPAWNAAAMTTGVAVYGHVYRSAPSLARGREVLLYEDGLTATVSVHRAGGNISLRVNGKTDASNGADMHTQTMSAHLPLLAHPDPKSVLVIGLASGVTVGAAAQHPVERIDVVEIEPAMRRAAQFFADENRRVLDDPRVRVIFADGRNFLLAATQRYDVIISEPSNPWIRGVATLFTREFYTLARSRLNPGGVMLQWAQGYALHPSDLRMVVRTYQEAFPAVSIWSTYKRGDYLLLGRAEPRPLDLGRLRTAYETIPGLRQDMARSGQRSPYALLADFVLAEADATRFGSLGDVHTDDLLQLEFSAPRSLHTDTAPLNSRILRSFRTTEFPPVVGDGRERLDDPAVRYDLGMAYLTSELPSEAATQFERALRAAPNHVPALLELAAVQQRLNMPIQAVESLERALKREPGNAGAYFRLSQLYVSQRAPARALEAAERAVALKPRDAAHRAHLARLLHEAGRLDEAARHFQTALESSSKDPAILTGLGMTYLAQGRGAEALPVLEQAQALRPDDSFVLHQLGRACLAVNQHARATTMLGRAAVLTPQVATIHADLGRAYLSAGDLERAASSLERAIAVDPAQPGLVDVLGTVYARLSGAP